MVTQTRITPQGQAGPETYRVTARIVGVLFLAAIVAYGVGNGLIQSILAAPDHLSSILANRMQVAIGALLMVMNSAVVATIGVMVLPVLKRHHERIAFGYFGARIIEAIILALGVVFLLLQLPLGRAYLQAGVADTSYLHALSTLSLQANDAAFQIAMIALGLGSLPFCYLLYRSTLVPRPIAAWGFVGYAIFLCGAVLEIVGFSLGLLFSIPGGLWELFIGVWLIVKGFSASPVLSTRSTAATTPSLPSPDAVSATT